MPNITPKILRYELDPFLDTFWRRGEKKRGRKKGRGRRKKEFAPWGGSPLQAPARERPRPA